MGLFCLKCFKNFLIHLLHNLIRAGRLCPGIHHVRRYYCLMNSVPTCLAENRYSSLRSIPDESSADTFKLNSITVSVENSGYCFEASILNFLRRKAHNFSIKYHHWEVSDIIVGKQDAFLPFLEPYFLNLTKVVVRQFEYPVDMCFFLGQRPKLKYLDLGTKSRCVFNHSCTVLEGHRPSCSLNSLHFVSLPYVEIEERQIILDFWNHCSFLADNEAVFLIPNQFTKTKSCVIQKVNISWIMKDARKWKTLRHSIASQLC